MNAQHHEVSIKVVNSYQSIDVINAFYALFDCRPREIRIVHRFYPDTCRRDVQVFAEGRLVKTHTFTMMGNEQVRELINHQIRSENEYMFSLVLRDVYNFLQANAIEHYQKVLEFVRGDYREIEKDNLTMVHNIS